MKTYNPRQSVELFHLLFLSQLGRKLDKKFYALKGGCNMRFYFNSIRYSEDMDIDIQTVGKETLFKNVNQIFGSTPFKNILKTHNLEILSTSTPKQTSTTQRWKILLKSPFSVIPLNTKIEFSRREFHGEMDFESITPQILKQYSLMPIMANHYSIESMYKQKILALVGRTETQARDIFDLYLLISSGSNFQLNDEITNEQLSLAKENALSVSFSDFTGQVVAYLSEDYQTQYSDESVWNNIVMNVLQSLDNYKNDSN
ncbi:MAG: nucleotidyl transferase AbiEii/AbiGii toxin family protein [Pseudomonadota bacterium]